MNHNSDDEEFFDAIGDESKFNEIKNQFQKENLNSQNRMSASKPSASDKILNEKNDIPNLSAKQVSVSEKAEENSDHSKSISFPSTESAEISKTLEAFKNFAPSQKNFFASLYKKKGGENEIPCENIKQNNKNFTNFNNLITLQSIEKTQSPRTNQTTKKGKGASSVWVAKFSLDNKFLAVGDSEGVLKIYTIVIENSAKDISEDGDSSLQIIDPNFISLEGHNGDIIDISWYKDSKLLLSCSIDKIVKLWNIESQDLVKVFEHADIVSSIAFHPLVNEFFASGCFDKIIRIWDINEAKVIDWVQANDLITALTFSPDKNHLLVGFYLGTVKIYRTDQGKLKFTKEITCKNKFSWGKVNKVGKKVTGIIFTEDCEFLVMTNDSRMRLIDFRTFETIMKYKGHSSGKYHIQPSYNNEKELILSGSEDSKVYVWNRTSSTAPQVNPLYTRQKKNRNTSYEYFKPFGSANTTCAIWLPTPVIKKYREKGLIFWKDIYVDSIMILFSSDSRIKVLSNLVNLGRPSES